MTRRYWKRVGGTLVEEFLVVPRSAGVGPRRLDGVIIVDGDHRKASWKERINLDGHDIIVVQTKANRLGMYLMGQALFSRVVIEDRFKPADITHGRALCYRRCGPPSHRRAFRDRGHCGRAWRPQAQKKAAPTENSATTPDGFTQKQSDELQFPADWEDVTPKNVRPCRGVVFWRVGRWTVSSHQSVDLIPISAAWVAPT